MTILDESDQPIFDETGITGIADESDPATGPQRHRWVLKALSPLALGPNHEADLALKGRHLDQVEDAAGTLLTEMFPDTNAALLPDWERLLGLPDACAGEPATLAQRVAAVAAKWAERRQLSVPYLIDMAARLGFAVTISNRAARRYGQALLGTTYCGKGWANTITVHAPGVAVADRIYLECLFSRLRPAQVYLDFDYS